MSEATFEVIDVTLRRVSATLDNFHVECYLHQSNLLDHEFTVVEVHSIRAHDFTTKEFDDAVAARLYYEEAAARTKARIRAELDKS